MNNFNSSRLFQTITITVISLLCILFNSLTLIHYHKFEWSKNNTQYVSKGIDGGIFDKNGFQTYSIQINYLFKYPQNDKLFISNLSIEKYKLNSTLIEYFITAKNAWFNVQSNLIFLGNNTYFKINNIDKKKIINVYSKNVYIDVKNKNVYGDERIMAIQGGNKLYSNGFKYDNQLQYLTLKSNVKVIYE